MLRPWLHTSNLDIWSFYRTEALAHSSPYDIELTELELKEDEDQDEMATTSADTALMQRVVNGCYDNVQLMQPSACFFVLSVSSPSICFLVFSLVRPRA